MLYDCGHCGASLKVEAAQRTANCPYCASPNVLERAGGASQTDPMFAVGFRLEKEAALRALKEWVRSRSIFAHSGVKNAEVENMRGLYMPAGLYSCVTRTAYAAEIAENYTVTETYTTTDSEGKSVTRTRTVTRTEYRSLQGEHASYAADVLVSASRGISNGELEAVEPYDLRAMRRYTLGLVSGWIVEEPTRAVEECFAFARQEVMTKIGRLLSNFMPGDGHRELRYQTRFERETTDTCLLPIWVIAARHDPQKPPFRVLINGQTGKVVGKAPLSTWKIALAIAIPLLVLLTLYLLKAR